MTTRYNDIQLERLNNMIEDVESIAEDLDEFFPGEFDAIGLLYEQVLQALRAALTASEESGPNPDPRSRPLGAES